MYIRYRYLLCHFFKIKMFNMFLAENVYNKSKCDTFI